MTAADLKKITHQVLYNCDISDAHHAGMFSICGLALRLRDLYKWENKLPPWEERDSAEVLEWIEVRENRWEQYSQKDFVELSIDGKKFDPFDTIGINKLLEPKHLYYGAGYARSLKPTFFLAAIGEKTTIDGNTVYILEREMARDLLTIPALTQDGCVLLRQETARFFIWDKIFYINKSARPALRFALQRWGLGDLQPEAVRQHLTGIVAAQKEIYIYHEIGELHDTVFEGDTWRQIIAAFPASPVEHLARAVKDLAADTNAFGTLQYIVKNRQAVMLAFYVAFLEGLVKEFFPELPVAFQQFMQTGDWEVIEHAVAGGYRTATDHARLITEIYQTGVRKKDLASAAKQIQQRLLGKYMQH